MSGLDPEQQARINAVFTDFARRTNALCAAITETLNTLNEFESLVEPALRQFVDEPEDLDDDPAFARFCNTMRCGDT